MEKQARRDGSDRDRSEGRRSPQGHNSGENKEDFNSQEREIRLNQNNQEVIKD